MLKKLKPGSAEFKAGIFIIISVTLLLFSILWLRYFAITPEKRIIARFTDPGPVETGIPVYYQGVNIGKVPKVGFSKNFRYTYVYMEIYNREIELPANVTARVKIEGIAGQKYLCLTYPEKPVNDLLASGDVIEGETTFGIDNLQEFFKKEIESGRLEKMFKGVEKAIANANKTTEAMGETSEKINALLAKYDRDIDDIIKSASGVTKELNEAVISVNKVVKSPEFQEDLKNTVKNANGLMHGTKVNAQRVFDQIEESRLIPNMSDTVNKTHSAMEEAEKAFKCTGKTAKRFDRVGENMNKMLSKRFLLFKLMFGRPGEKLSEGENVGR